MDTERIREFRVVAEVLNFRRAAEQLALSPSTLSRHIEELEHELGFKVLLRDRHSVAITVGGRALLDRLGDLPDVVNDAIADVRGGGGPPGTERVRLGYGEHRGMDLIELLVSQAPTVVGVCGLELVEAPSGVLVEQLISAEVDLALVRPPIRSSRLEERLLVEEPVTVVVPRDHPLAARAMLARHDVRTQPLVAVRGETDGACLPALYELSAVGEGQPGIVQVADTVASMYLLVEAGVGIGLVGEAVFRRSPSPALVQRRLGPPRFDLPLHLAWRRDDLTERQRWLRDWLVSCADDLGDGYRHPAELPAP